MYSKSHAALVQSRGELNLLSQDADGSHTSAHRAGVLSPFADSNFTNDVNADGDTSHVDDLADKYGIEPGASTGMLVTDSRSDVAGGTTSTVLQKHDSSYQYHTLSTQYRHDPSYDDDSDSSDDAMSDIDGGAPLHMSAPSTGDTEIVDLSRGGFPLAVIRTIENDEEETEDDNDNDDDDYLTDDQSVLSESEDDINPNDLGDDETSPPSAADPSDQNTMNASQHLQSAFGATMLMGPEFQTAGWGDDFWPAATGVAQFDDDFDVLPPILLSNPNPLIPGSENLGLVDFLRHWAYQGGYTHSPRSRPPHLRQVVKQANASVKQVTYAQLDGDRCDFQGLDWTAMDTTRVAARARRQRTYKNYVNHAGSDDLANRVNDERLPSDDSYFRFKRIDMRQDVHLAHFQLRSVLACPSRTHAYYPSQTGVNRLNKVSRKTDAVMSVPDFPAMSPGALSTLDAACGVLMAGTFGGEYYLKSLDCNDRTQFSEGQITSDFSGITNHIKIYRPRRSSGPVAAIASNDCGFRVMDITTEQFISETMYPCALNCSALSPDHRLRAVVGDYSNVLITNADTGEVLQELSGHRDYGFSCDWSDDGWTVATGFQDRSVKIWDARRWCNSSGVSTPICTIRSEMASVRGLRFSPVGSGKPVLAAAEEADFVNIIDAQTFSSKQTVDIFGEIGGVAFTNDGHDLNVLCCDRHRGGLLQFDRCGRRAEPLLEDPWLQRTPRSRRLGKAKDTDQKWSDSRRPTLLEEYLEPF